MSTPYRSFWPGAIVLVLGVLFLLNNLDIADFGDVVSKYWPLILVIIGIALLLRGPRVSVQVSEASSVHESHEWAGTVSDTVSESAVFGNISLKPTSRNFRGGSLSTVFGNVDLNLSAAELAEGESHLGANGVFGNIHITLPKDTLIEVRSNCLFGEVKVLDQKRGGIASELSYRSPNYDSAPKKLRITASQVFGDIKIW